MKKSIRQIFLLLLCVLTMLLLTACAKRCEVEGCGGVVLDSEKGTLCSTHIKQYYENAMADYSVNLSNDISNSIKNSSNKGIISSVETEIDFQLEERNDWWTQTEVLTVTIKVDDAYDDYKFSEQFDIAYACLELAEAVRSEKKWSYDLMEKWLRGDTEEQVRTAYGYEFFSTDFDIEFCVQTTRNKYYCSDTMGDDYFRINSKEYYSTIFEEAYSPGSTKNRKTCEVCSKEGTYKYESFTGQTEYYCYKHYQELNDMLDGFGLD